MKYIKIGFFICAIVALFSVKASAQNNISVSAIVLDAKGNHISGAKIASDKNQEGVKANESGEFSLTVEANSVLTVEATGYKATSVKAALDLKKIVLESNSSEMVQVAFNKVAKSDLLGGVSSVNVAKIFENNYTTYSTDNLSSYIPGYHGNIWGMGSKLVLVDGIPRDEGNVMPSEIEDISVLKSAAAVALYGSRASKGVVYITTKRGTKGNNFNVRLNSGYLTPKGYANYLDSAEYMTLYNEARANDGLSALYSNQDIANYASGANPYRFPNVDFYSSDYLKNFANRLDIITEYSGGTEKTRFYMNIANYNTTSLLNFGNAKDESENRFNVRGNLDIKITDKITGKVNTSVTFDDNNMAQGNFWGNAATMRPNQFSPLLPVSYMQGADAISKGYVTDSSFLIDGKYLLGGLSTQTTNPFADVYTRGIMKLTTRKYQFDTSLNFNLASLLKGLSFDTQFGIDYNTSYRQNIGDNTYAVYTPTWTNDNITSLTKIGQDDASYLRTLNDSYQRRTAFFSGAFKYNNSFNEGSNVSANLIAHAYSLSESELYHSLTNANLGLQISYNYKHKYYLDFTENMVHSSRLTNGHENAFSPTASLGWRLSNEKFLSNSSFIDDLKLTASAGILNTDLDYEALTNQGYYLYNGIYSTDNGAYFSWQEGRQLRTTDVLRGENLDLGYEQRKEFTLGLEASFFKNMIQLSASYFYNKLMGLPVQISTVYPNFLSVSSPSASSFIPYVNYNADQRKGFDLGLSFNKQIQKVALNIGMVATYYESDAYTRNENYEYSYQNRQGRPTDAIFGLKSEGFFSQADIDAMVANAPGAHVKQFGTVKAGDIKYVDVNNDGIVDDKDQVYLGRGGYSGAPLTIGFNATVKWNNFTLFVLANSASGYYGMKSGSYYWATTGNTAKYSEPMLGRWTPETAETATYPSLTTSNGDNNYRNSDFWLYKKDKISLAKIQVNYDLPKNIVDKTFFSSMGFYINGNDLFLIAKERELLETNIGSAPQLRSFNIGFKGGI